MVRVQRYRDSWARGCALDLDLASRCGAPLRRCVRTGIVCNKHAHGRHVRGKHEQRASGQAQGEPGKAYECAARRVVPGDHGTAQGAPRSGGQVQEPAPGSVRFGWQLGQGISELNQGWWTWWCRWEARRRKRQVGRVVVHWLRFRAGAG
ncbi:hypothetical protein BCR44DRAFT_1451271 [Catenaria anguillulae PL171]|uniref:Uncharacterized protein n=1 Tax=Catenaria anguillulae PL171 TaxID=765915 RepID=A0A1Y2H4C5_9FUNG|nr:hypothetical protein BCR44DRAFT_1451271 [Catenaria anguillulae PL171]